MRSAPRDRRPLVPEKDEKVMRGEEREKSLEDEPLSLTDTRHITRD
jgi:hypothetical protein